MPSGRTNNFPESGSGLGHVTPTIFGSTVGYPSDSLASCLMLCNLAKGIPNLIYRVYFIGLVYIVSVRNVHK